MNSLELLIAEQELDEAACLNALQEEGEVDHADQI